MLVFCGCLCRGGYVSAIGGWDSSFLVWNMAALLWSQGSRFFKDYIDCEFNLN